MIQSKAITISTIYCTLRYNNHTYSTPIRLDVGGGNKRLSHSDALNVNRVLKQQLVTINMLLDLVPTHTRNPLHAPL